MLINSKLKYYKDEIKTLKGSRVLIGQSDPVQRTKRLALQVSGSDIPVLITGESGTGKETIAYYIHETASVQRVHSSGSTAQPYRPS